MTQLPVNSKKKKITQVYYSDCFLQVCHVILRVRIVQITFFWVFSCYLNSFLRKESHICEMSKKVKILKPEVTNSRNKLPYNTVCTVIWSVEKKKYTLSFPQCLTDMSQIYFPYVNLHIMKKTYICLSGADECSWA